MSGLNKLSMDRTAITARNAVESPLFRLPAELRNRIYHYALGGAAFYDVRYPDPVLATNIRKYLVFLATCRHIHAEAGFIPLGHHEFRSAVGDIMVFRLRFSLVQLEAIRFLCLTVPDGTLELRVSVWEQRGYGSLTALFPNLKKIVLDDEYLDDDYDDCIHCSKDVLETEREEWKKFMCWVRKDMKEDVEVEVRSQMES